VREILAELTTLQEGGPTLEEVEAARDFSAGVFGLGLETVSQVASRVSQLVVFGLDDAYFSRYRDEIRSVTVDAVAEAAAHHLRPSEAQIVVVGDADSVVDSLESLALGPVEVRRGQRPS
jgi:predicted Zn-dependent peptidase